MAETYYLTGFASDLSGGADFSNDLRFRSNGVYSVSVPMAGTSTETSYAWTIPGTPGVASWGSTQTWYVYVDVTSSVGKTWLECKLERVNASGTVQETKTSTETEQDIDTAGVFTWTFSSISWSAGNATDRIRVTYIFRNSNHGDATATIDAGDSYITADMTATPITTIYDVFAGLSTWEWFGSGGATLDTTEQYYGYGCARANAITSGTKYFNLGYYNPISGSVFPSSTKVLAGTLHFKTKTEPSADDEPILRVSKTGSTDPELRLNSSRQLVLYTETTLVETGTTALTDDTWYTIQFVFQKSGSSGVASPYEVLLNGSSELSGTADFATGDFSSVSFGKASNRNSETVDFYYDDVVLSEEYNTPDAVVSDMRPNADGTDTGWTATSGDKWDAVNNLPLVTSPNIYSSTTDEAYTADLESSASAGVSGAIYGVCAFGRAIDAGGGELALKLRLSSAYESAESSGLSTHTLKLCYSFNPDDDQAFATADLDAAELGARNANTNQVNVYELALFVIHEEPSGTPVSDTFVGAHETMGRIADTSVGAHEALGYLTDTVVGAHEAMSPVVDTFIGAHEAMGYLADTAVGNHEVLGYLVDTFVGDHEATGESPISDTFVGSHEALMSLAGTFAGAHEALLGVLDQFVSAHEALEYLSDTFGGEHEALGYLAGDLVGNHEVLGYIAGSLVGAHEANQGAQDSFGLNHEALLGALNTFDGAHEVMGWIVDIVLGGHEAMKTLEVQYDGGHEAQKEITENYTGAHEAQNSAVQSFEAAHEAHGFLSDSFAGGHEANESVSDAFTGAHEAVESVEGSYAGAHEAHGYLSPTFGLNHEVISADTPVSDTFLGGHESMKTLFPTFIGGHEAMEPLSQTFGLVHEAFLGVLDTFAGGHEALGYIEKQASANHEAHGYLAPTFDALHEAMSPVADTFGGGHEASQTISDVFDANHEAEQEATPVSDTFILNHEALGVSLPAVVMDAEQIIKWCFDSTNLALRTTNVGAASGDWGTHLDWRQVIKKVYDSGTNKLRVTTVS
jgi:hypothetical protein